MFKLDHLRNMAKRYNIKYYTKLNKKDLINAILLKQNSISDTSSCSGESDTEIKKKRRRKRRNIYCIYFRKYRNYRRRNNYRRRKRRNKNRILKRRITNTCKKRFKRL